MNTDNMKMKTVKKTLMCELTDKERREYGISLATTLGDMGEIEAQKKREMDHFKDRIAGLQAKADELSRKVRDGKEWRDVECHIYLGSPDKEHKQTVRLDTGETVQTERMTEADLQLVMPFDVVRDGDESEGVEPEGETVYDAADEEEQDGPPIVDAEEDDENEDRELSQSDISALLITLEGYPKLQRKKRLVDLTHIHGRANMLKFSIYKTWNDADPHLVKMIAAMIKEMSESQPEGGDADY